MICPKKESDLYTNMYNVIIFNNSCYDTNKYAHFKNILEKNGFDDKTEFKKTQKGNYNELTKINKQLKYDEFNPEDHKK
jgi:hypothetical protein